MDVTSAVRVRSSIRSFLPTAVTDEVLRSLLEVASHAPSGGNVQPWRVYVVNGESMTRLREFLVDQPPIEAPEYDIYPAKLTEPYRTNRFAIGEQMYATLGIEREDKAGRLRQFAPREMFNLHVRIEIELAAQLPRVAFVPSWIKRLRVSQ